MAAAPLQSAQALPDRKGVYRFQPVHTTDPPTEPTFAQVRDAASGVGIQHFGVTDGSPLEIDEGRLRQWLDRDLHGGMRYLETAPRGDPRALFPEVASVVVIAVPHLRASEADDRGVANYAIGADYHHVLKTMLLRFGIEVANLIGAPVLGRLCVDTAPLLERALATRSGLGFIGKSTLSIVPGLGSYVLLGELLLDVALPAQPAPSAPTFQGCGSCTRCLDACPTQAFVGPFELDARRCISYLTIEATESVPEALRADMGTALFGCDVCQDVCPFNQSKKPIEVNATFSSRAERSPLVPLRLLSLTSSEYRKVVKGTALKRASRTQLQRNAAIALGNGDYEDAPSRDAAVNALIRALFDNPSPEVRSHAAWALGRLGSENAKKALVQRQSSESEPQVQAELGAALSRL